MGPPDIVVFFTDPQRHDVTGVHGKPLNLTPNFDRLAGDALARGFRRVRCNIRRR